ncbi:NAD(P)-binding protein [Phialemonium atrogriseum]|uniref:NAD(P)-binding protein n=1 Tax=Phialemonium atrogriseum TaxID=1093897 RepID=A0AAJ0CCR1_9PEZI|nr:NAD(P)-binding protein [Phialemonium atrogriseum]KAK1771921.1 NAD(P)-binding protein [Phialemonium atrogriseum]
MAANETVTPQYPPRLHNDVYPFIYPSKFKGSLQGKVAIITGAAGTIGQGLAESFAVAGATLVLVYNRTKPSEALLDRCRTFGASAISTLQCNVSQLENCEKLVQQVLDSQGKVDILVNNAGANDLGPLHEQTPEKFIHDIAVNFHGPYYLMRLLLPTFRKQRSGCILNIASRAGTVDIPYSTSYCASKAALINLTGCVQKEVDIDGFDDIHLYSLHPGGVKSEMTLNKYSEQSLQKLPPSVAAGMTRWLDMYNDSPHLNGMVCVALAAGVAKEALKGKYFDVGQDLEDVVNQAAAIRADPELYSLHTNFLGGLSNGNPVDRPSDEPFDFPGF